MSNMVQMLIGKRLTPEEQVHAVSKWRSTIRAQERQLDRQIRNLQMEEEKVKKSLKAAAKRPDARASCVLLAKELVRSRKAKDRMYTSKAQLNSMVMQLQQMMATAKVAGTLKKSTEVMKLVNNLMKLPEIGATIQEMSKEMMKAGIIDEMIQDAIEMQDDEEIEEEAEFEVNKVLFEVTDGMLGAAGPVGAPLPVDGETEEEPAEMDKMESRLAALRAS